MGVKEVHLMLIPVRHREIFFFALKEKFSTTIRNLGPKTYIYLKNLIIKLQANWAHLA